MCIQTPGSFVWAVSLAAREGTAWSSWITYVVTGCLQGCLLVMCIGFEIRERRGTKGQAEVEREDGEGEGANGYGAVNGSGERGEEERRPLLEADNS